MGIADRIIRLIIAIVLIDMAVSHTIAGNGKILALIISIIFLITSSIGACPIYSVFGFRTKTVK
jgi:hypothetical protein